MDSIKQKIVENCKVTFNGKLEDHSYLQMKFERNYEKGTVSMSLVNYIRDQILRLLGANRCQLGEEDVKVDYSKKWTHMLKDTQLPRPDGDGSSLDKDYQEVMGL